MSDDLERFVIAQADVFESALAELRRGAKETHWMWFIFPQIAGLGQSSMAKRYAIKDAAEAHRYLMHPILGPRLEECCRALLGLAGRSAHEILGSPDDLKLKSSMTLFDAVSPDIPIFGQVLARFYGGERDRRSLELLGRAQACESRARDRN